ncbi:TPA: hypothetical protein HA278_06335 [Candidatus Woesearchaeota archaeon]|nr:hypothetical protein [Candidatus Woesearchaeota archaeon]
MGYWNEGYSRKKQKEMTRAAVEQERQKPLVKPKPLYREYYSSQRRSDWQAQRQKEQRFWILGGVIIGIVAIAGIFAIVWAASL